MKKLFTSFFVLIICSIINLNAQSNRINYNNQELFLSGMNLAWVNFANDLTSFDSAKFALAFKNISNAGGNSVRWWLHTNGTASPQFTNDSVSGLSPQEIPNMKKALDMAQKKGIGMIMCLWSFDMLESSEMTAEQLKENKLMLSNDTFTKAYINNALMPIIDSLGSHPAVLAWEVFNEPEGMSNEFGWSYVSHVPMSNIQRFINQVAGAIHRKAPTAKVVNGS